MGCAEANPPPRWAQEPLAGSDEEARERESRRRQQQFRLAQKEINPATHVCSVSTTASLWWPG